MGASYMKIKIDGTPLAAGNILFNHLLSVSVSESLDQLDDVQMKFIVPEGPSGDPKTILAKLAAYGKTFEVELYHLGKMTHAVAGDIIEITWARSQSAPWSVTLHGHGNLHRMKAGASKLDTKKWVTGQPVKVDDVVKDLASKWNVTAKSVPPLDATQVFQAANDDASLLLELAKKYNRVVRWDSEDNLHFAPPGSLAEGAAAKLSWGIDVIDTSLRHLVEGMISKVEVKLKDAIANKEPVVGTANADTANHIPSTPANKGPTGPELLKKSGNTKFTAYELVISGAEGGGSTSEAVTSAANATAKSKLNAAADQLVSGSFTCRFRPDVQAGGHVEVDKGGWPLNGKYIVKDVSHTWDASGYRTQLNVMANRLGGPIPT
jgi:phage protein D